MKLVHLLLFACAGFLSVSPAYAHGEKGHDNAASAAASAGPAKEAPATDELKVGSDQSVDTAHAGGHDKASGGHHSAAGGGRLAFIKKLHPATIHFPIALFLMAALAELFVMAGRGGGIEPAVRVLIYGGAVGAVVAALFGWIHTGLWFGGDTVMQLHRWNGMLIAALGLALALLASKPRDGRTLLRTGLFSMAALILFQGFLGGELAHGPEHLGFSWI